MKSCLVLAGLLVVGCTSTKAPSSVANSGQSTTDAQRARAVPVPPRDQTTKNEVAQEKTPDPAAVWQPKALPKPTDSAPQKLTDFVGAEKCAECHGDQFKQWDKSTHGQAGGPPSPQTVRSQFDGFVLRFRDASVTLSNVGGKYTFEVNETGRPRARFEVSGVVGSGRIFGGGTQTYFTTQADGRMVMLPFDYSTTKETWFCQTGRAWLPIASTMSIRDCAYPPKRHLGYSAEANCQDCHGSQIRLEYDKRTKKYVTSYTSLRINCESCHGPGRRHSELMAQPGKKGADIGLAPLDLASPMESIKVCGRCHMDKSPLAPGYLTGYPIDDHAVTLHIRHPRDAQLGVDGSVRRFTYQEAHLYSACFVDGSMTCVDCHNPHDLAYRDIWGKPIADRFGDQQCVDCHPSKMEPGHHRHAKSDPRCVDCHMPLRQHPDLGKAIPYMRSDHAVSIPRLKGIDPTLKANACGKCHQDKSAEWINDARTRLFGAVKPEPPGAFDLNHAEAKQSTDAQFTGPSNTVPTARDAVRKVPTRHGPLVLRALSSLIAGGSADPGSSLGPAERMKIVSWMHHEQMDVRGAAIASAIYFSAFDPKMMLPAFDALKTATPDEQVALRRRVVFNLLAIMTVVSERGAGASVLIRRLIEDYGPSLVEEVNPLATLLATGYRSGKRVEGAIDWFQKALRDPRFKKDLYTLDQSGTRASILNSLGRTLLEAEQTELAERTFKEAIGHNPRHLEAREALCLGFLKTGRRKPALDCITEFMALSPDFVQGYFIKARLYEEMGDLKDALTWAEKGLAIDRNNPIARKNVNRLRRRLRR